MRTVQSASASPALRRYVRAFAQRTAEGAYEEQPMPAYLESVIQFDFGALPTVRSRGGGWETARRRSLVGPHTYAGTGLRFEGHVDSFAIFLQPTAPWSLFRIPVAEVMETHFDADDVFGPPVSELWDALAEAADFRERVRAAEAYLSQHLEHDPEDTATTAAAKLLARQGGQTGISDVASHLHVSLRQLERAFVREMGITPKRFARVARFQRALDARVRTPGRSWIAIATDAGYFDQMHLVHEFHSLGGLSPTLTLQRLGDSRPSALASSDHP